MWWWFPPFQPGVCHRSEQHPRFWLPECHHPDVVYCPFLRENELQDFHRCSKCKAEDAKGCEWMSRESFTFGSRCRRDLVQVIPLRNYLLGYEPPAERKWSSQCWQLLARAFFCWCLVASSFSKARSCPSHHCTTLPEDVQPQELQGAGCPKSLSLSNRGKAYSAKRNNWNSIPLLFSILIWICREWIIY